MGYSNWSDAAFSKLKGKRKKASRAEVFTNNRVDPAMNPYKLKYRESRDSDAHPNSNAIIVGFDVTGSMGSIPETFAKEKLGGLMKLLVERDYIEDPQMLFAGIGDSYCDSGPLQVGQFESGLEMDMWLTRIWIESGGGGQIQESYGLAHYFAAHHTSIDCWEKRGKKGYLFTMGDELTWDLPRGHVKKLFGYDPERNYSPKQLIAEAKKSYEVFHIIVADGYHGRNPKVQSGWKKLLGERALILEDVDGVCDLIGTTIGICEGNVDIHDLHRDLGAMGTKKKTIDAVVSALAPIAKKSPAKLSGTLARKSRGKGRVARL